MNIFVAGGTGVLGRRVVPALVAAGHAVTANVRDADASTAVAQAGATPTTVDLFDPAATSRLADVHDTIVNVATSIPTGMAAARPAAWRTNDRLRTEASANLAAAMSTAGGRYIGESITFPYIDGADSWIDEDHPCSYVADHDTCRDAERSAASVNDSGGVGVALRFAMFYADDSAHVGTIRSMARLGVFGIPGTPDAVMSWIHIDDAAAAVIAALDAPAGVYNVAEREPSTRQAHAEALARSLGRRRVRVLSPKIARLGGAALMTFTRSQRVSSQRLTEATGWQAEHLVVDAW